MQKSLSWPVPQKNKIYPIFLPWLGCGKRCIFCSQELQTGVKPPALAEEVEKLLKTSRNNLEANKQRGAPPPELAFYGSTFTALPEALWQRCLSFAAELKSAGLISGFRCSTRPDKLSSRRLEDLCKAGCKLVELGIQSFNNSALEKSGRGYDQEACISACEALAEWGLGPGVQLMPGMPGSTPVSFLEDVKLALVCEAKCLRFYPCLVIAASPLAALWAKGAFNPWPLEQTLDTLAQGWLLARKANAQVIRMGLAPQSGLEKAILAGPQHPSLGSRVISRALYKTVKETLNTSGQATQPRLQIPNWLQGCFWGWQKELAPAWAELGISGANVSYWGNPEIRIEWGT